MDFENFHLNKKPHIKAVHGGPDYRRLEEEGKAPDEIIDFSVCVNPFPLPAPVLEAVMDSNLKVYPDPEAAELVGILAEYHTRSRSEIMAVNGISQGIWLLSLLLGGRGKRFLVLKPVYGEYEYCAGMIGTNVLSHYLKEEESFQLRLSDLVADIRRHEPDALWICNPNNPTGGLLKQEEVKTLARECRKTGGYLVLDEAYVNFVEPSLKAGIDSRDVIILRSMTKDFGFPGLRLGYILGRSEITEALKGIQPVWSLNSPALAAGKAALENFSIYESQWETLRKIKENFVREMNLPIIKGSANFLLLNHGRPDADDRKFMADKLWSRGILVRDCTSFGLSDFFRIGILTEEKNKKLITSLGALKIWER